MANQTIDFYRIHTLTNLHAGSGDTTYGIVDNMVQRDPASEIPVIHASSLKGAIRQYYREANGGSDKPSKEEINIFGSDTSPRSTVQNDFSAGNHLFFEARLLVLPVRSDRRQFFRAICPELVKEMMDSWKHFGYTPAEDVKSAFNYIATKTTGRQPQILSKTGEAAGFGIEKWDYNRDVAAVDSAEIPQLEQAEKIFGDNLLLVNISDFKEMCRKLPVLARNQLENGQSQNLFYEEVVPRESLFFTYIMYPEPKDMLHTTSGLQLNDKRVQVGANATIGNGQCRFHRYGSVTKTDSKNPEN